MSESFALYREPSSRMLEQDAKKRADRGQGGLLAALQISRARCLPFGSIPVVCGRQGIFAAAKFLELQKIGARRCFSVAIADETEPRAASPQG